MLRLAGWDLRERFRAALLKSEVERREVEERVAKGRKAGEFLAEFVESVDECRQKVEAVVL